MPLKYIICLADLELTCSRACPFDIVCTFNACPMNLCMIFHAAPRVCTLVLFIFNTQSQVNIIAMSLNCTVHVIVCTLSSCNYNSTCLLEDIECTILATGTQNHMPALSIFDHRASSLIPHILKLFSIKMIALKNFLPLKNMIYAPIQLFSHYLHCKMQL